MHGDAVRFARNYLVRTVVLGGGRVCWPPLHPIPVKRPFQIFEVDIMDLPTTQQGNKHVVVFQFCVFIKVIGWFQSCVCYFIPALMIGEECHHATYAFGPTHRQHPLPPVIKMQVFSCSSASTCLAYIFSSQTNVTLSLVL